MGDLILMKVSIQTQPSNWSSLENALQCFQVFVVKEGALPFVPEVVVWNITYSVQRDWLSTISTIVSIVSTIGMLSGVVWILPLMDSRGRKFVAVNLRCILGVISCSLQALGGWFQSAELFIVGQLFLGLSIPIKLMVVEVFVTECAPDSHRGMELPNKESEIVGLEGIIRSLLLETKLNTTGNMGIRSAWHDDTVRESLSISWMSALILAPLSFLSTFAIDIIGRRPIVFFAAGIIYLKILLMFTAQLLVVLNPPSLFTVVLAITNEFGSNLVLCTGVTAVPALLLTELIPLAARAPAAQVLVILAIVSTSIITSLFPLINALFPPTIYAIMLFLQPFIVAFLIRHLPETKQRPVYEIVHGFEEDIRSRVSLARTAQHYLKLWYKVTSITNVSFLPRPILLAFDLLPYIHQLRTIPTSAFICCLGTLVFFMIAFECWLRVMRGSLNSRTTALSSAHHRQLPASVERRNLFAHNSCICLPIPAKGEVQLAHATSTATCR
uniref:MFS domain-containing protein n=1 Tax=Angiostrongylus cantonensis TaxID=6313 RepID=A0A0K0D3Y2_ANGCA